MAAAGYAMARRKSRLPIVLLWCGGMVFSGFYMWEPAVFTVIVLASLLLSVLCAYDGEQRLSGQWQLRNGGVGGAELLAALMIALQSAILSVLLEWYRPIRNWKIESDL